MEKWIGKIALVTGVGSGMGAAIAEKLVEQGVQVVGLEISKSKLDAVTKKLSSKTHKFHPFLADVSKETDLLKAFKWTKENLGSISILVNNAGVFRSGKLTESETKNWTDTLNVNLLAYCICTREGFQQMKADNINGHIININSEIAHFVPQMDDVNLYCASKHAVKAMTECLRLELISLGSKIKVTSISPGFTKSELIKDSPSIKKVMEEAPSLEPEDIANTVVYVLSTPPHVQITEITVKPVGSHL